MVLFLPGCLCRRPPNSYTISAPSTPRHRLQKSCICSLLALRNWRVSLWPYPCHTQFSKCYYRNCICALMGARSIYTAHSCPHWNIELHLGRCTQTSPTRTDPASWFLLRIRSLHDGCDLVGRCHRHLPDESPFSWLKNWIINKNLRASLLINKILN